MDTSRWVLAYLKAEFVEFISFLKAFHARLDEEKRDAMGAFLWIRLGDDDDDVRQVAIGNISLAALGNSVHSKSTSPPERDKWQYVHKPSIGINVAAALYIFKDVCVDIY